MKPHISINGRFTTQQVTGVQRYASEIYNRTNEGMRLVKPAKINNSWRGHIWEQFILPNLLESGELLWSPGNTGPLFVRNQVVTIHDISPIEHPEWFTPSFAIWYRYLLPRLATSVYLVFTVSQFTRQRLINEFNLSEEKVLVIPNGVNPDFCPRKQDDITNMREKYSIEGSYILSLGSLEPRKNLNRLFQAWKKITRDSQDIELVVVGEMVSSFRDPDFDNSITRIRFLGRIDDQDLPGLYSGALCFIYPSIYEGFGLPVLEAMACGTPVITSNTTSLPEVAGDACLLINPYDTDEISETIQKVLQDANLHEDLRTRGLLRAKQFSWEKTAAQVWNTLETAYQEIFS